MKKALTRFILLLLLIGLKPASAQIDTAFWFAAPWVTAGHAGNVPVVLRISTFNNATAVRVRQPASTYDTTINIGANSLYSKFLSHIIAQVENSPANTVLNRGLKISSDYPINVVYEVVTSGNNPETYSLKGQNGLGKEFVAPFQTRWDNGNYSPQPKSMFCIVASENNTTVWITPRAPIIGHPAGISYSITLNQGQSYTCENVTSSQAAAGNNLSGSIIVADKLISVTVSDDSAWESAAGGCRDLMGDQIVPVDVVGKEYIINKGQMFDGTNTLGNNPSLYDAKEGVFVVATQNFTQLSVNDGTVTTTLLNQGDTYYYNIKQNLTYITADKNVYVIQASGFGCELGEAIIPPLNCSGSNQVSFTRTNTQTFILNVLCKTSAVGTFTLNGNTTLVPASGFTVVPGTGGLYSGFQKSFSTTDIPANTANLLSNSADVFAMGVINGGSTTGCLYHYMSSFLRKVITNAGNDTNICVANTVVPLHGHIEGGSTSGIWTTVNGTGSFGNNTSLQTTYTLSTNDISQPQIKFVLTSTGNCTPVRDTMVVTLFTSPIVTASGNSTLCVNNISPVPIAGTLQYAAGAGWSGGNGGSFGNAGSLNTTYLPSPADLSAGSVKLYLTSTGSFNGCANTRDSVTFAFTPAPAVLTGGDVSVCANNPTVSISGTVSAGASTGVWSSSGSGLFSPTTTTLNPVYELSPADIAQGTLVIKLTSTNNGNCNAEYDSLIVTVTSRPQVDAGINDTICSNNTLYNLAGTVSGGASAGFWTTRGNGSFTNANNLNTIYTIGQADTLNGAVTLVLTSTGSNCLPEQDSITVTIAKAPLVSAGPDGQVCNNQKVLLNGSVIGLTNSGAWTTLGTGFFTPNDSLLTTYYQPSALDVANGQVLLVLTSINNKGCSAVKDTIELSFKAAPNANFIPQNVCAKDNGTFNDNSNTPVGSLNGWYWEFGDNSSSIAQNTLHSYNTPGTYTVTHAVTSTNGCTDTVKKPIEVYFLPQAQFFTSTVCKGNNTQFVDSSKSISGSLIQWQWLFGDCSYSGVQNPKHAYGAVGTYTVNLTVTSSFGCKDTINQAVNVIPGPIADFNMSANPVEALVTVNFTDVSTGPAPLTSWYWNLGDSSSVNVQNPQHQYQSQGIFTVMMIVQDINGCVDTARKDISVVLLPDVPTAFSPNADGQNDIFYVKGGPFKGLNMQIYNNWGQVIFESNDQTIGWDGTFNGTAQPLGVYVWVVDVETYSGKKIRKTGDVTLLR